MIDLAWISPTATPAVSKLRRLRLSPEARAVGDYSRELWPHLDLALRRRRLEGAFIPLEDLLWPASLQRALLELRPRLVHIQFHPDFWPGRTLMGGALTQVLARVRRETPEVTQWVTLHAPPTRRFWGRETLKSVDRVLTRSEVWPAEIKAVESLSGGGVFNAARGTVPGVQGTVSREPRPSRALVETARPQEMVLGWSALADRLADSYFKN